MLLTKRSLLRIFLISEIVIFTAIYFFGSRGLYSTRALKAEVTAIGEQKKSVEREIDQLTAAIKEWQEHDFYTEKLAREQLQMARPEEQLYVIIKEAVHQPDGKDAA